MSEREPTEPYIYKIRVCKSSWNPFVSERESCGLLWGVGGVGRLTTIDGLTKAEAEAVCKVMRRMRAAPLVKEHGDAG